jgi:hypothetical protein
MFGFNIYSPSLLYIYDVWAKTFELHLKKRFIAQATVSRKHLLSEKCLWLSIWDLYYKTLRIRNLRENDKFCSKLAYSGLDKNPSMDKQKH